MRWEWKGRHDAAERCMVEREVEERKGEMNGRESVILILK
jgi:hypothetical protein